MPGKSMRLHGGSSVAGPSGAGSLRIRGGGQVDAPNPGRPIGAGAWGRSMVIRVPSGTTPPITGPCLDHFDRTATNGWDIGTWCLPAWTPQSGTDYLFSAADSIGSMNVKYDGVNLYDALITLESPPDTYEIPGTVKFKVRRQGTGLAGTTEDDDGEASLPFGWWFSPTANRPDVGSAGHQSWFYWIYNPPAQGPWLMVRWFDYRGYSGGTWAWDFDAEWNVDAPAEDLWTWWNVTMRIDEYGTYVRWWKDGTDEFAVVAPTQPEDTFGVGCPQGGGEQWLTWEAYSVPLSDLDIRRFAIESAGRLGGAGTISVDVDLVKFEGSLCRCCLYDDFYRIVADGYGTGGLGMWAQYTTGDDVAGSVDGTNAVMDFPADNATFNCDYYLAGDVNSPWRAFPFTMTSTFTATYGPPPLLVYEWWEGAGFTGDNLAVYVHIFNSEIALYRFAAPTDMAFADFTVTSGTTYAIEAVVTASSMECRIWAAAGARPDDPTASLDFTSPTESLAIFEVVGVKSGGAGAAEVTVDYITYCV